MSENEMKKGVVATFNEERKFGFAEVGRDRVFFHMANCRVVEGTPENPIFTQQRSTEEPRPAFGPHRSQFPSDIIAVIEDGPKGKFAKVWGYAPKRTWLEDLEFHGRFQAYVKGEMSIMRKACRGRFDSMSEKAILQEISFKDGKLTIIRDHRELKDDQRGFYSHLSGGVEETFDMEFASNMKLPYGRLGIKIHQGQLEIWLIFYPPSEI